MKKNRSLICKRFFTLVSVALVFSTFQVHAQQIINTVAGNGFPGYLGDGGLATAAKLNGPIGLYVDAAVSIFIADYTNHVVRKVDAAGTITTIAGSGTAGYSGDGFAATTAQLRHPSGVWGDASGNIFIADFDNNCIRKVNTAGIISTIAGNGTVGYSGDGFAASSALLFGPTSVFVDASGSILIADTRNHVIRKINSSGIISTVAGNGSTGAAGDGFPATTAQLFNPFDAVADAAGNIYISDQSNNKIRKVNTAGIISTIAGTGPSGYTGDGAAAIAATLNIPTGLWVDASGTNIYIADKVNNVVRKIDPLGIITTVAASGVAGIFGDGGLATAARMYQPLGVGVDGAGRVYISDFGNDRVRVVEANDTPSFTGGKVQSMTVCQNSGATSINTRLDVMDSDMNQTETWSIYAAALHGTVVATYTTASLADTITPTGLSYTPTLGYTGADQFKVIVSDGLTSDTVTINVTVNPLPVAGTITGPGSVCVGATITLSNATIGGTWSSSNTTATVSAARVVTGMAAGTDTIIYTVTNACGVATATKTVVINSIAVPAPISGPASVCWGSTITLSDATVSGVWSSSNTNASVSGGVVSGLRLGASVISYTITNICGPGSATTTISVVPLSTPITGTAVICQGANTALSNATTGGTWNSVPATIATISSGGLLTGMVTGSSIAATATITYQLTTTGCMTARVVTVNATPAISGPSSVCRLASVTLTETTGTPGFWFSGATVVATVSAGVVTGASAGTVNIDYTASSGGCTATKSITVNPIPAAIGGPSAVCNHSTIVLTDADAGGVWSSNNTALATVGTGGDVTGVLPGTPVIAYTFPTTGCRVTVAVTVHPQPAIAGPTSVCELASITLTEGAGLPGTWLSGSTSVGTVTAGGVVTGASAGTTDITFTATSGGCTDAATITVNPLPAAITGIASMCAGATTTLSDVTGGGTWSTGTTAVATASPGGVVTGATTGSSIPNTATIIYRLSATGCAVTRVVTVNPLPAITGPSAVCEFSSISLFEATGTAGTWTSSLAAIAPVTSAGLVTGSLVGTTNISYTAAAGGCAAFKTVTVNPIPAPITGALSVCQHDVTMLADSDPGGIWSSSNTGIATAGTGDVTGIAAGSAVITYSFPVTSCFVIATVNVRPSPVVSITAGGPTSFCPGGSVVLNASPGYTYQWYNGSVPLTGATGVTYTAATSGMFTVRATNAVGCSTLSAAVSVSSGAAPVINTSGATSFCYGDHVTLTANTGGAAGVISYQWQRNGTNLAGDTSVTYSADTAGIYTCVVSIVSSIGTCSGITPAIMVAIHPLPMPVIHKIGEAFVTASHFYTSYQWYVNTTPIPGASTWSVIPVYTGNYRVSVTDSNGCTGYSTSIYNNMSIETGLQQLNPEAIRIFPNPTTAVVHIECPVKYHAVITGVDGRILKDGWNTTEFNTDDLVPGMYFVTLYDENGERLTVQKLVKAP